MLIWQKHVDVDAFLARNIWKFMQIMKLLLKVICTGYENVKRCSNTTKGSDFRISFGTGNCNSNIFED